jgi:hypothetical protein
MDTEKDLLLWLVKHIRYTQALCEIIIENLPDKNKRELIKKVHERVKEMS